MTTAVWGSKLHSEADVDPKVLLANPWNYKKHSEYQATMITGSLSSMGWIERVKVNINNLHIMDGHERIRLAVANNQPTVPVQYLDLTEDEELQALVFYNQIAALAEVDNELLAKALHEIETEDEDLAQLLIDTEENLGPIELDEQPTEAFQRENPYSEPAKERDEKVAGGDVSAVPLRVIQLYLTPERYEPFIRATKKLGERYGLETVTDIVEKVVADVLSLGA